MRPTWTEITKTATVPGNWSNANVAKFHYFNPAGLNRQKIETDALISALVAEGKCRSGAIMAYGTFNDCSTMMLLTLATERTRISRSELGSVLKLLRDDIEKAKAFIAEKT